MATPGLFHELKLLRRSDGGIGGQEDQDARSRGVVQARPGELNLDQFPQDFNAEVLDSPLVGHFGRVCVELATTAAR